MNEIRLKAPAKINLFLKVLGKRDDGYHNIHSWFQAVSLFDNISFKKTDETGFNLDLINDSDLPTDNSNLIVKTAQLMFEKFGISGGLKIELEKNIPLSAGLAGGSTDSATTIYAINRLYNLGIDNTQMAEIGAKIGSDIPFFFSSGQAEVTGRGELIKNIELPLDYQIVLVNPGFPLSTKEGYSNLKMDLTLNCESVNFFENKGFRALVALISHSGNCFEMGACINYPELDKIRETLRRSGASLTRMSGSGPTMFGLFKNMPEGGELERFTWGNWRVFYVHPITLPAWH